MKRPLCVIAFAFAPATWLAFSLGGGMVLPLALACAATGLLCMAVKKPWLRVASLAFLSAAAAFLCYGSYYQRQTAPLYGAIDGTVEMEGVVLEEQRYANAGVYLVKCAFPQHSSLPETRIVLRLYGGQEFTVGDTLAGPVRLYGATTGSYPSRGAFVQARAAGELLSADLPRYATDRQVIALRNSLQKNIQAKLSDGSAQVVGAMVLGMRGGIPDGLYRDFSRSGIIHLLYVSGLHFSVLIACLLEIGARLKLGRRGSAVLALAGGLAFAFLVGFSSSIVRAFVMSSFLLLGRLLSKRSDSLASLGAALLVICVVWPHWTQGAGMWLSFASTLGIVLYGKKAATWIVGKLPRANALVRTLLEAGAVSLCAGLFTLPVLLVQNGWISLVSPLANMAVTLFVPPLLLAGLLCAAVPGNPLLLRPIAAVAEACATVVLDISRGFASLPMAALSFDEAYKLVLLAGIVGVAAVLIRFKANRRLVAYGLTVAVVMVGSGTLSATAANRDKVELVTLEDGGSLLIRGKQAVVLGTPSRYTVGNLCDYLRFRGVEEVAAIVAADAGNQVDSGLLRLSQEFEVGAVLAPEDAYIADQMGRAMKGVTIYPCGDAVMEVLGGVHLQAAPDTGLVQIAAGKYTVLVGGLSQPPGEGQIVLSGGQALLPEDLAALWEPVGSRLFGETRVLLEL